MAKIIGKNKRVIEDDSGNLVFSDEIVYGPSDMDVANAVVAGDITAPEQTKYMKDQIIFALHQELHDIFKAVQGYKQRAESVKKRLQALGVNTDNLLTKKIPPRPVPPKKKKAAEDPATGDGKGKPNQ